MRTFYNSKYHHNDPAQADEDAEIVVLEPGAGDEGGHSEIAERPQRELEDGEITEEDDSNLNGRSNHRQAEKNVGRPNDAHQQPEQHHAVRRRQGEEAVLFEHARQSDRQQQQMNFLEGAMRLPNFQQHQQPQHELIAKYDGQMYNFEQHFHHHNNQQQNSFPGDGGHSGVAEQDGRRVRRYSYWSPTKRLQTMRIDQRGTIRPARARRLEQPRHRAVHQQELRAVHDGVESGHQSLKEHAGPGRHFYCNGTAPSDQYLTIHQKAMQEEQQARFQQQQKAMALAQQQQKQPTPIKQSSFTTPPPSIPFHQQNQSAHLNREGCGYNNILARQMQFSVPPPPNPNPQPNVVIKQYNFY